MLTETQQWRIVPIQQTRSSKENQSHMAMSSKRNVYIPITCHEIRNRRLNAIFIKSAHIQKEWLQDMDSCKHATRTHYKYKWTTKRNICPWPYILYWGHSCTSIIYHRVRVLFLFAHEDKEVYLTLCTWKITFVVEKYYLWKHSSPYGEG